MYCVNLIAAFHSSRLINTHTTAKYIGSPCTRVHARLSDNPSLYYRLEIRPAVKLMMLSGVGWCWVMLIRPRVPLSPFPHPFIPPSPPSPTRLPLPSSAPSPYQSHPPVTLSSLPPSHSPLTFDLPSPSLPLPPRPPSVSRPSSRSHLHNAIVCFSSHVVIT